ncbi:alpha/beta hydrolase [Longispora fulva]|uniref:Pimeloyl-ACP methyl ester carboxylesterase n=1 Tax=Longispora fulva TaxID=619741 RepID=A0A8J7GN78_9ACTN|nr:alpha/beta fold hydrolase [Longispora fulva]MBG6140890.1 pimeloyl-ACP methyl ester carboxylesterase [Longispora fulva]GIG60844.1 alpha/beta hydrolase [Longispora fulva]
MIPTVLLHAFPLSSAMFAAVDLPGLIAPDLAGFGTSAVPDAPPGMSALAADVVAELDRRGLDRVVLGGVSMGGYVAMAVVREYPERVGALILADTKAGADAPDAAANRLRMAESVLAGGDDTDVLAARMLAPGSPVLAEVQAGVRAARPEAVAWAQRAMAARPDSFDTLRQVTVPTLVIVGELDSTTPPAEARLIAEAVPGARLVTIPGSGHLPPWERPAEFTAAVREFMGGLPAGARLGA